MKRHRIAAACLLLALVAALGVAGPSPAGAQAGADPDVPPRRRAKLLEWVLAGSYRDTYAAEPAVHPSLGPHGGNVRTYFNSILAEDLAAGRTTFRKGATMVKELYFGGTEEAVGYAVMTKVKRRSGRTGKGWLFYETFDRTGQGAFYGRGIRVCSDCHGAGTDYLLSPFRP